MINSITMKNIKLKIFSIAVILFTGACTGDFEEMNVNPNSPTTISAPFLLTTAIERSVDRMWGSNLRYERLNIDGPMCWMGYLGRNIYGNEGDDYTIQPSVYNNNWKAFYNDALSNLNRIIVISAPEGSKPNSNYEGMAITLQSWIFSMLTDMYGPIPYSTALKGASETPVYSPEYDTQEVIYADLLTKLKTANEKLVVGGPVVSGGADILYAGNILKWKKFANSLRLRLANRQAAKKPAESRAVFAEILGDPATYPIFVDNLDNARLVHTVNRPSNNEWHEAMVQAGRTDWNVGKTLIDKLIALSDTRLPVYAQPVSGSNYAGIPNGLPDAVATTYLNTTSKIGTAFLAAAAPSVIMTYSELQFILAEAVLDGDLTIGTAQTYFENGIAGSFIQHGAVIPADYISNLGAVTRELIFDQKYIALYGQGIEAWTEYRRTGLPVLPEKDSRAIFVNDGVLPTRLPYPTTEQSLNAAEYARGVELIGGADNAKTPMWWVE
ncbi:MAG: SusD/RagB family nutrient-binding outer membrane lipoprotein [Marivirga sp.]|nr:SusD/RagB family nutrient-binding outer membrane lipoprotein [Marivirga sp.]